jgi:hypothetical protein
MKESTGEKECRRREVEDPSSWHDGRGCETLDAAQSLDFGGLTLLRGGSRNTGGWLQ